MGAAQQKAHSICLLSIISVGDTNKNLHRNKTGTTLIMTHMYVEGCDCAEMPALWLLPGWRFTLWDEASLQRKRIVIYVSYNTYNNADTSTTEENIHRIEGRHFIFLFYCAHRASILRSKVDAR